MMRRSQRRIHRPAVIAKPAPWRGMKDWLVRLLIVAVVAGVLIWIGLVGTRLQVKVVPVAGQSSHNFMVVSHPATTVLLVAQQGQDPSSLDRLMVVKADHQLRQLTTLVLPANLSDGEATAGQYLENGYYKELQLLVERSLALPVTGYLIEPRGQRQTASWIDYVAQQPSPGWWDTTVNLPGWLNQLPVVQTNLSGREMLSFVWLARDLKEAAVMAEVPEEAKLQEGRYVVLDEEIIDPLITDLFVDQTVKEQAVSLVIKNATLTPGLAALSARYATHLGGEVVAIEPSDSNQTRSSMTATQQSHLSQAITQFLGVPLEQAPATGRERADVELILGQDVLGRLGM